MDGLKYTRLIDRLEELKDLNKRIAKLRFYMLGDGKEKSCTKEYEQLEDQLIFMVEYRGVLEQRIYDGNY